MSISYNKLDLLRYCNKQTETKINSQTSTTKSCIASQETNVLLYCNYCFSQVSYRCSENMKWETEGNRQSYGIWVIQFLLPDILLYLEFSYVPNFSKKESYIYATAVLLLYLTQKVCLRPKLYMHTIKLNSFETSIGKIQL